MRWLAGLALAAVLLLSASAEAAGTTASPRARFDATLTRLTRVSHAVYVETDSQRESGRQGRTAQVRYTIRYRSPNRVTVVSQVRQGTRWVFAGEIIQVAQTTCLRATKWICRRGARSLAELMRARLLGPSVHVTYGERRRGATTSLTIASRFRTAGQPFRLQYGSKVVVTRFLDDRGDLEVDTLSGLPRSFTGKTTVSGYPYSHRVGSFDYVTPVIISLPKH